MKKDKDEKKAKAKAAVWARMEWIQFLAALSPG